MVEPIGRVSTRWRRSRRLQAERCNRACTASPTMFIAMLGAPRFARFDLQTCARKSWPGFALPVEVHAQGRRCSAHAAEVDDRLRHRPKRAQVSFQSAHNDPLPSRRVSTVEGAVQPHLEVKIIDPESRISPLTGVPANCSPAGGYSVFMRELLGRYRRRPHGGEWTRRRFMHTGDTGDNRRR